MTSHVCWEFYFWLCRRKQNFTSTFRRITEIVHAHTLTVWSEKKQQHNAQTNSRKIGRFLKFCHRVCCICGSTTRSKAEALQMNVLQYTRNILYMYQYYVLCESLCSRHRRKQINILIFLSSNYVTNFILIWFDYSTQKLPVAIVIEKNNFLCLFDSKIN